VGPGFFGLVNSGMRAGVLLWIGLARGSTCMEVDSGDLRNVSGGGALGAAPPDDGVLVPAGGVLSDGCGVGVKVELLGAAPRTQLLQPGVVMPP